MVDEPEPGSGAEALRRFTTITGAVSVDLLRDPGPPVELMPPDWPGGDLRRLLRRVAESHLPVVLGHLEEVIRRSTAS